jgi:alpha-glucosidase
MTRTAWAGIVLAVAVGLADPRATTAQTQPKAKAPTLAKVGPVPEQVRTDWKLDPYYTKYASAGGLPVVAPKHVNDRALQVAAWIVVNMTAERPELLEPLIELRVRVAIIPAADQVTDLPEYAPLRDRADYWNKRARGLGATPDKPATSCGEENLLGLPGDRYRGECVLTHEFGHSIHELALRKLDPQFDSRLQEAHAGALKKKLWANTYSATDHKEYWAEGVQSYFDCNMPVRMPDGIHNGVWNNVRLKQYDPTLHDAIDAALKAPKWRRANPIPMK